uniref:Uncharacterized protein n=1 Tax=Caenorhabditis japonica TaxID=281687 RepID=A0A8R1HXJ5_CAEJA
MLKPCTGLVQVDVSQITVNFPSSIKSYLPDCYGVNHEFFLQISTSNYSSQTTYFLQEQPTNALQIAITNSSSFQIPSATDFISLSAILSMRCSVSGPVSDSFLLATQVSKNPDKNNVQQTISATSDAHKWTITINIIRRCTGVNEFGFNCNEQCTAVDNAYSCYTCGSNGQKLCCQNGEVNQDDCSYYNSPPSTTWSPNVQCSSTAENTYFWLMISFAIIIVILAILLALVLLELCCGLFTGHRNGKGSEDRDWIVENEPRANRQLYDDDINRTTHQYRRRNEERERDRESPDENSRRSPYIVSREGLDNQTYDDDSLQNQWVEPQPRRIARV